MLNAAAATAEEKSVSVSRALGQIEQQNSCARARAPNQMVTFWFIHFLHLFNCVAFRCETNATESRRTNERKAAASVQLEENQTLLFVSHCQMILPVYRSTFSPASESYQQCWGGSDIAIEIRSNGVLLPQRARQRGKRPNVESKQS